MPLFKICQKFSTGFLADFCNLVSLWLYYILWLQISRCALYSLKQSAALSQPRTTDTQWRHKSKISEKLGRSGRQNMLRPYLKIWEWEWIFGRAVKAFSSLGVRSPWSQQWIYVGCINALSYTMHVVHICIINTYYAPCTLSLKSLISMEFFSFFLRKLCLIDNF
jgi:hypothetical protein